MFCLCQTSRPVSLVTPTKAYRLVSHRHPKRTMTNRFQLLAMVHTVMTRIKNAASREQRFNLLENAQILAGILQEVTQYEQRLIMDLDVD